MKNRFLRVPLAVALLVLSLSLPQRGTAEVGAGTSFGEGRTQLSLFGGGGSAFSQSYLILGMGANYYILEGLGLGMNFESWFGNTPAIYKITPGVQYVFTQAPSIRPYVGGFLRRVIIESRADLNSVGLRGGAYLPVGPDTHLGLGGVYERYQNCNEGTFHSCSDFYPEISFTISF